MEPKATAWLHCSCNQSSTNDALAFSSFGGSLETVTVSGSTDVGVTGALFSSMATFADGGTARDDVKMAVPLDPRIHCLVDGTVHVRRSDQLLASMNTGAVTSGGSGCEVNVGVGCASLVDALRKGTTQVSLRYSNLDVIKATLCFSDVRICSSSDSKSQRLKIKVIDDDIASERFERAEKALVEYVNEVVELRANKLIYPFSPQLFKPFTTVVGVGYSSVESLLHVDTGLNSDQLEDLLRGMAVCVLDQVEDLNTMMNETSAPSMKATQWTPYAAKMIHYAARVASDYHVDGVVTQTGDGKVRFEEVESWAFSPTRRFFHEAGDCDNGGTIVGCLCRQIGLSPFGDDRWNEDGTFRSIDPTYDPKRHKMTTAVRNSLSHTHTFVLGVFGASTGEGTKAESRMNASSSQPIETAAGHCVAMLMNTASMLDAMRRGDLVRTAIDDTVEPTGEDSMYIESEGLTVKQVRDPSTTTFGVLSHLGNLKSVAAKRPVSEVDEARAAVFYPPHKLASAGVDPATFSFSKVVNRERLEMDNGRTLALDGTVTNAMELSVRGEARRHQAAIARRQSEIAAAIGPSIADRVIDLTSVGKEGSIHAHSFYMHAVEITIPGAISTSKRLSDLNAATHQFVFVPNTQPSTYNGSEVAICGSTPQEIDDEEFSLMRLGKGGAHDAEAVETLRATTRLFSMPSRNADAAGMTKSELENVAVSRSHVLHLHQHMQQQIEAIKNESAEVDEGRVLMEYNITPRMMASSPASVAYACEKIKRVAAHGWVDVVEMNVVQPGACMAVARFKC